MWNWFADNVLPWFAVAFRAITNTLLFYVEYLLFQVRLLGIILFGLVMSTVFAIETLADLAEELVMADLVSPASTMITYYAFINKFIPLHESIAVAIIIFQIWGSVNLIRWAKSFIPTISN